MPTNPLHPDVGPEDYISPYEDINYSKGPKVIYGDSDVFTVVLNDAQADDDDEWGRTEQIALRMIIDEAVEVHKELFGYSGILGLKDKFDGLLGFFVGFVPPYGVAQRDITVFTIGDTELSDGELILATSTFFNTVSLSLNSGNFLLNVDNLSTNETSIKTIKGSAFYNASTIIFNPYGPSLVIRIINSSGTVVDYSFDPSTFLTENMTVNTLNSVNIFVSDLYVSTSLSIPYGSWDITGITLLGNTSTPIHGTASSIIDLLKNQTGYTREPSIMSYYDSGVESFEIRSHELSLIMYGELSSVLSEQNIFEITRKGMSPNHYFDSTFHGNLIIYPSAKDYNYGGIVLKGGTDPLVYLTSVISFLNATPSPCNISVVYKSSTLTELSISKATKYLFGDNADNYTYLYSNYDNGSYDYWNGIEIKGDVFDGGGSPLANLLFRILVNKLTLGGEISPRCGLIFSATSVANIFMSDLPLFVTRGSAYTNLSGSDISIFNGSNIDFIAGSGSVSCLAGSSRVLLANTSGIATTDAANSGNPSIKWMTFTFNKTGGWPVTHPTTLYNTDVSDIEPNIPAREKVLYVLVGVYDSLYDRLQYGYCNGYSYSDALNTVQKLRIESISDMVGGGPVGDYILKVTYFYTA